MKFAQVKGNREVCDALRTMVDSGKVPHAIMFEENDGGSAMQVALAFLQYLYCHNHVDGDSCGVCSTCNKISKLIHPDMQFIFPVNTSLSVEYLDKWRALVLGNPRFTENDLAEALEIEGRNAMIKVDESKRLLNVLSFSALERGYRAVVVYLPEKMNKEAANRLLKLIEEPPALTEFVFITHAPEQVLVTISSRCQRIKIADEKAGSVNLSGTAEYELFRSLMQGLLARDLYACLDIADRIASLPSREKAKSFCKLAGEYLRYVFLLQQGMDSLVELEPSQMEECRDWAERSRKTFPRKAMDSLSRAQGLIIRNVNTKILFTDLVNGLYRNI